MRKCLPTSVAAQAFWALMAAQPPSKSIMQDNEARLYLPITASLPPSLVLVTSYRRLHLLYERLSSV
jgi:hypothetical protein